MFLTLGLGLPPGLAGGAFSLSGGGGDPVGFQFFTASGTYTPSAGVTHALVICVAGGAAGGAASTTTGAHSAAGGGGGGAAAASYIEVGASHTITIGAGGSASTINGTDWAVTGGDGGNTTFDTTTIVAEGGQGTSDRNITTSNGAGEGWGGIGGRRENSTGDFIWNGGYGDPGNVSAYNASYSYGGNGGNSGGGFGQGGIGKRDDAGSAAGTGAYGGGGAGGCEANGSDQAGAAGSSGCVIILEFSS